ncbi:flotillin family protein [Allostreptomyces psammosilenae]|uniref:Flotillin n=1 Tax=Allostreptomyces psammosilenae TaxID=1892865 RepID=A0A852ZR62_9ACTN|nr:flotillin family protein [Allostreptomyces psammosilenae]NYI04936.1 flotillin [Allostreptomyces psammosilenae]
MPLSSALIAGVGIVVLIALVVLVVISRYKVAGPNEAFIITGRRGKEAVDPVTGRKVTDVSGQKVVVGGGVFVVPFIQHRHSLDLSSRRIPVSVRGAVSLRGVKVNLEGVAIVKVGGNEDAIRAAAQRFLRQQKEVETFTKEVLSGALRSIVGRMSVEDIIRDRAGFAAQVAEESETSLVGQGLALDTIQIQDITAEGSYLEDLGRPEAARARQDADIAEANARRTAQQSRLKAEEDIAVAQRTLALRQAEIKSETDAAAARAAAAGPLAEAAQRQHILGEQEKVAERQAALKDRELDTEVRKPADASRYREEQEAEARRIARVKAAEADRVAAIAAAQAEAERARLTGEGEKQRRAALAEAVRLEGEAQAASIAARGSAEAEAMRERADAFDRYGEAAVLEMIVSMLPEVVAKAAEPLSAVDKLTVISTDGAGRLPRAVAENLSQGLEMVTATTGIDLAQLLSGIAGRRPGAGTGTGGAAAPAAGVAAPQPAAKEVAAPPEGAQRPAAG